jgi:outer membrane protein assembly factor BamB
VIERGDEDNRMLLRQQTVLSGFFVLVFLAPASAGEWPQILGPARNGIAQNEQLTDHWPADGPPVVWQHKVGSGYAGPAVAAGKAILWHRVGDNSVAEGLDARTGKSLWKQQFPTHYVSSIAPDDGPRCVPLVNKGRVYLVGADGDLHCLALADGKPIWSRDAFQEFQAPSGYFGAGSTPIVDGDKLLLNVGAKGAGIVAFSLADGSTAWQSTDEAASYSSPTAITLQNKSYTIFVTRLNTLLVDPQNGAVQVRFPFGMRGPTVNAATPLVIGDHLFLSASYGVGARWLKVDATKFDEDWDSDELMSSQYTTCVEHEGVLYGIDGRQDAGVARLRAFDPRMRKIFWTEEGFGPANIILADGKLVIVKIDGELLLVEPSPREFRKLASAKVLDTTSQPLPALANGLLYVRDTEQLKCLRVGR